MTTNVNSGRLFEGIYSINNRHCFNVLLIRPFGPFAKKSSDKLCSREYKSKISLNKVKFSDPRFNFQYIFLFKDIYRFTSYIFWIQSKCINFWARHRKNHINVFLPQIGIKANISAQTLLSWIMHDLNLVMQVFVWGLFFSR